MALLQVKGLTHSYDGCSGIGHDAIRDISFAIEKGEIVGIIGHTGSGKSTLVQHLNGLLKPTDGQVLLEDRNIWENPKEIRKIRSRVGLVFQYPEYQLFEETVFEDIAFGPKNMGLTGDELSDRVKSICEIVGVKEEYFSKSPFDLSGGEKRRVAIAGVMAMLPEIIVLDEPMAGLDPIGRETVIRIIGDYRRKTGATVLVISHSMEDMAMLADKLIVLNEGRLYKFDTVERIFAQPGELRKIGLDVPMVTRVFEALRAMGADVPADVFTLERAVEGIRQYKAGKTNAS